MERLVAVYFFFGRGVGILVNHFHILFQCLQMGIFKQASLIAGKLLDTYITDGLRLAWMMVTRSPPMIAIEPKAFDPQSTILEDCHESEVLSQPVISLRPTLFFSYAGEVAVQGILTLIPSSSHSEMQDVMGGHVHKPIGNFLSSGLQSLHL